MNLGNATVLKHMRDSNSRGIGTARICLYMCEISQLKISWQAACSFTGDRHCPTPYISEAIKCFQWRLSEPQYQTPSSQFRLTKKFQHWLYKLLDSRKKNAYKISQLPPAFHQRKISILIQMDVSNFFYILLRIQKDKISPFIE